MDASIDLQGRVGLLPPQYSPEIACVGQLEYADSLGFVDLQASSYDLFDLMRKLSLELGLGDGDRKILLQLQLRPACGVGRLPMQQLINENSESPDVGLGAVDIVDESFGGHVDGRADIDILEFLSDCNDGYLVNLANPKSAIFALLLCRNTLATFRSRWMTFF